jgi:hypothetical protein
MRSSTPLFLLLLACVVRRAAGEPLSGLKCDDMFFHHTRMLGPDTGGVLGAAGVYAVLVLYALLLVALVALPARLLLLRCALNSRRVVPGRGAPAAAAAAAAAAVAVAAAAHWQRRALATTLLHGALSLLVVLGVPPADHAPAYRALEAVLPPDPGSLPLFAELEAAEFEPARLAEYTRGFSRGLIVRGLTASTAAVARWSFASLAAHPRAAAHMVKTHHTGVVGDTMELGKLLDPTSGVKQAMLDSGAPNLFSVSDWSFIPGNAEAEADLGLTRLVPTLYHGAPLVTQTLAHQFNLHLAPSNATDVCASRGFGWHGAPGWNLATLVRGAKNWTFVSVENMVYLRPFWARSGTMYSWWGHEPREDEPDHGAYAAVPVRTITQRAGDVIYFPAWVAHKTHQVAAEGAANEVILVTFRGLEYAEALTTNLGIGMRFAASQLDTRKWRIVKNLLLHKLGLISHEEYMARHGVGYES